MALIETDYLIVGAGAAGMSFADVLLSRTEATMTLVDRRHAPGGHWLDAYPFARLHMPSACYGVDSTPMGGLEADPEGDSSLYERAGAAEICAYYDRVLHHRFLASGRVRFLPGVEHLGDGALRKTLTGEDIQVRFGKLVDATCTEGDIPATTPPPFEVAPGATCIPIGELPKIDRKADAFVVIGAGKTGQDACLWLLARGVPEAQIHWVRPRDPWIQTRRSAQPGPGLPETIDIYSRGIEAASAATSLDDLFLRLEEAGVLVRLDQNRMPDTYQGAIISDWEVSELRRIENVVRLGHIQRIEPTRIVFEAGEMPTTPDTIHIHCAAGALGSIPARPVFAGNRINVQNLRYGLLPLSAGIAAFVEARDGDEASKNALCGPLVYSGVTTDWVRQRLADLENGVRWRQARDLQEWVGTTRLSINAGAHLLRDQPKVVEAMARLSQTGKAAAENMRSLLALADT